MDEQYGKLIEPHEIPFRFGAPGWYVVAVLLVLLMMGITWLIVRWYKRNYYRREELGIGGWRSPRAGG